ncbi:MAG: hypothetical protein EOP09_09545 [Proteobacteria bacterium]|nr:MAG: hypothetical protein EOP09_09545 [Pseudomonadota bacterium]
MSELKRKASRQAIFKRSLSRELVGLVLVLSVFSVRVTPASELSISSAGIALGGSQTEIGVGLGYHRSFANWLQGSFALLYQTLKFGETSVNAWSVRVGPTFNMDGVINQAYFLGLGYAYRKGDGAISSGATDPNATGPYLQFGKRISLGGTFSLRPNVSATFAGGAHIRLEPLSVSYFF